uniref:Gem (nuclear organelle) associated protein 4 n=1 Tax=Gasterosteus aculeatus aculeatus TaxID=481459 RepID=A0AAQ4NTE4_GASAC
MTLKMNQDTARLQGAFLLADKLCVPSSLSSLQKADWSRVGRPVLEALREICGGEELCGRPTASAVVWLKTLICTELERLVRHVRSDPTGEEDVALFLEVWWELWKGGDEREAGAEDTAETMFAGQFARLLAESSSASPQAAKRLKLDASDLLPSPPTADVLHVLLHALRDLKEHVSTAELCLQALSISLDALHTAFLADRAAVLPAEEKLRVLCEVVGVRAQSGEELGPELIREAQRDVQASHAPSRFQPGGMKLAEALTIVTELAQFWSGGGLLAACGGSKPSCSAFRLEQSVQKVLVALKKEEEPETDGGEKKALRGLLESLAFPAAKSLPDVSARVAAAIVDHRLDGYQDVALLFASERSWAARDVLWTDCLERNQAAFQRLDALLEVTAALQDKLRGEGADVSRCRRLMKVAADIFSALSLKDKNAALAAALRRSGGGLFGGSAPSAVTAGFEQELNMAFNCIIQGGGAMPAQGNLNTAVSLVARVAFQNPEATLRACCHSAVFNKGAFSLMAKILQQLHGLRGGVEAEDGTDGGPGGGALLCRCLRETIGTKSLSANEKEQLLEYLGLLMTAVEGGGEEEEERRSFVTPQEVANIFVLPNISTSGHSSLDVELCLRLLQTALSVDVPDASSRPHWALDCSPFPLLYVLAQLQNQTLRCWEQPPEGAVPRWSMDAKELLVSVLTTLGRVVGAEVAAAPSRWSRALFWLYNKTAELDWTVRFHLKAVWGEHFKNEVPSSLLAVCDLPEQDWVGSDLPQYGQGTGLLAWMECCSASDHLRATMLSGLSLDQRRPDHVGMFSKGLLVALTQTLPWCSVSQWTRLLGVLRELIASGRLHVPFSLEYVEYLPLLDLRSFSCELRLSVLLLRAFQLLCGSSCSGWLPAEGWAHVGRLYAHAVRGMMSSVRAKLTLPSATSPKAPEPSCTSITARKLSEDLQETGGSPLKSKEEVETVPCQEVLFVLSQLFCHVQHIQVMMPGGQSEPLFLSSLEVLSHYEAVMAAFPLSSSPLESDNTRHFFSTITDNLQDPQMKAVLQQKIAQLVSA